jgi:hypothetical protein
MYGGLRMGIGLSSRCANFIVCMKGYRLFHKKTSESYLVLVSVVYNPDESVYNSAPLPLNAQRNFLEGAGEGLPFHAVHLQLEGVIKVEGTLTRLVNLVYLNSCSLNR